MSEMMMPCSYEAEQAVLGGLMLDNERWDEVILQIAPEDLFSRPHRMVFRVMAELAGEGLPLDLITITERLENRGDLEQCGGFAYLAEMSKNTPSAANILAYAGVVAEKSRLRQLMTVGNSLLSDVQAPKASSASILESAEGKLFNIAEQGAMQLNSETGVNEALDKLLSIPPANSLVTADSAGQATPAQKSVEVAQPLSSPRREISGEPVTPAPDNTPPGKLDKQHPRHEVQPDMYGAAPVISGESGDVSGLVTLSDGYGEENGGEEDNGEDGLLSLLTPEPEVVLQDDAPVTNDSIWHVPAHQDDIEHLQNTAFRLAWELGEVLGCEDEILPQRDNDMSAGYVGAGEVCSEAAAFLLGLTGEAPALHPAAGVCGLPELFTGGPGEGEAPALTDEDALKLLRLMRVMRRLRELQRGLTYGEDNSDE